MKPKFLQLGDVVKEGMNRLRKKKKDDGGVEISGANEGSSSSDAYYDSNGVEIVGSSVHDSPPGLQLEVVLPALNYCHISGTVEMQHMNVEDGVQHSISAVQEEGCLQHNDIVPEATKLLKIQQTIGFCYNETDGEIVTALVKDKQRDRLKKQVWEQENGH
jgi:hypothetical protein